MSDKEGARSGGPHPSGGSARPTFDVQIWAIRKRVDRRKPFQLRWRTGREEHSASFLTKALADGRRAELVTATRNGEAFDTATGLPLSELRTRNTVTWYEHARQYIKMKWRDTPAKTRTTLADAMATVTPVLVKSRTGMPDATVLRRALYSWAFNVNRWDQEPPEDMRKALIWIQRHSSPITVLTDPLVVREVLGAISLKLDGTSAAPSTVRRKRAIWHNSLGYAIEAGRLTSNPLALVRWTAPKSVEEVEPAYVVNPRQVSALLEAVRQGSKRGEHLEAFFGCMYFAAMRPAEVVWLRETNCELPEKGWGKLLLEESRPRVGSTWTDTGKPHDERGLKWRARKETRPVPIPPTLVRLLRTHVEAYGTEPDGRLFRTTRGGLVQESGYGEVWAKARAKALTPRQARTPLAARPYDLRHAGISFWLASGVPPTEVARRAGHSVAVLLKVYAKCLAEAQHLANARIDEALEGWE